MQKKGLTYAKMGDIVCATLKNILQKGESFRQKEADT
jgi:hypothetical protein